MPKVYYPVEDDRKIMLEELYDFSEAVRRAEQTKEAKEILVFKEGGDDRGLIGCYWIREGKDNKRIPE